MRRAIGTLILTIMALVMAALPASAEQPFPPADWQQSARFSGDFLYASFEGDGRYVSISGYDGSFKFAGVKGKGIQDQLVAVIFDMVSCDPVTQTQTELHLMGASFTGEAPVYDADTRSMTAAFSLHGIKRTYETTDCSWENRTLAGESEVSAEFEIDGEYVTKKCKGKCFSVCEFLGSMSLTSGGTNLLEGVPFDTVAEGFGGSRHGDIFWYSRP